MPINSKNDLKEPEYLLTITMLIKSSIEPEIIKRSALRKSCEHFNILCEPSIKLKSLKDLITY